MSYDENLKSISRDSDASVGFYTGVPGQPGSAVPNGGKQYHALKLTGKNQVGLATLPGDLLYAVLQNKPQRPGAAATCGVTGVTNVIAGGVIAVGDQLVPNALGQFVKDTTLVAKGRTLVATAPAAGVGDILPAEFL